MAGAAPPKCQRVPFNFDLTQRNAMLAERGMKTPTATKTGTTIVGCVYNGGIVLGADTRASAGMEVADKFCQKIHYMAPNIYCCGAGTAADCDHLTNTIASSLTLFRYQNQRETRVKQAETMLRRHLNRYQGHIGAYLVLGGVDLDGTHLLSISANGFVKRHRFLAMGSGSLAAESVLDTGFTDQLTEEQAKELVTNAISAGIFNDNGSGGNVDLCVMRKVEGKTKVDYIRPYARRGRESAEVYERKFPLNFTKGTTGILKEDVSKYFEISAPMEVEA
ncbi:putative proteasome subunit beta type-2 [Diplonema papillatum]|nr:putative proteasome subunit beta type-2 [Diplonema papillatum]